MIVLQWIGPNWFEVVFVSLMCLEMTFVVIWRFINKTELNWILRLFLGCSSAAALETFNCLHISFLLFYICKKGKKCFIVTIKKSFDQIKYCLQLFLNDFLTFFKSLFTYNLWAEVGAADLGPELLSVWSDSASFAVTWGSAGET